MRSEMHELVNAAQISPSVMLSIIVVNGGGRGGRKKEIIKGNKKKESVSRVEAQFPEGENKNTVTGFGSFGFARPWLHNQAAVFSLTREIT